MNLAATSIRITGAVARKNGNARCLQKVDELGSRKFRHHAGGVARDVRKGRSAGSESILELSAQLEEFLGLLLEQMHGPLVRL